MLSIVKCDERRNECFALTLIMTSRAGVQARVIIKCLVQYTYNEIYVS